MINDSMKLGGYVVGYGIRKKDGRVIRHDFDKPIHNTITKHMLNALLEYNGSEKQTYVPPSDHYHDFLLWMSTYPQSDSNRTGAINYAAFGDGTGITSTADTDLKHIRSEKSRNHLGGVVYTSTMCTVDTMKMRVSYQFEAVAESMTVREFGTYHRIEPDGEFKLTARVQFDTPIALESGDAPFFTYEIWVTFSSPTIVNIPGIGMVARKTNCVFGNDSRESSYGRYYNFPSCTSLPSEMGGAVGKNKIPVYTTRSKKGIGITQLRAILASFDENNGQLLNNNFPAWGSGGGTDQSSKMTLNIKNYVEDSFYRDYEITLDAFWYDDTDIYGLAINGELYQFGTMVNDVFTPSPWHKPADSIVKIGCRQSWSTDLLTPSA